MLDIHMPVLNGIDALKIIRANKQLKNVPVIMVSTDRVFKEAFDAGANDFIFKPVDKYEVLQRVQLNIELALKAKEVREQNELLKEQKIEVTRQRDIICAQQKELVDDLKYASYVQKAILPHRGFVSSLCADNFIFHMPKNIVSGDFYWVTKIEKLHFFVVGDCTGHGLSGGLMTMVAASLLNEIVNNQKVTEPDIILNELRTNVIKILNQKGDIGEAGNGFDIAVCSYNPQNRQIKYAGANSPVYIVRENKKLEIIKANRMPVGIYINQQNFSITTFELAATDSLYMFTDGFADQFGGIDGQKFRYNKFQELLVSVSNNPMKRQEEIIKHTLLTWKKGFEQVDDILLLGLKF
jgi:serine phosphatase RsbU (regulator of sigma subunit)